MDFLGLKDQTIIIFGLANKRSVACSIGKVLIQSGARLIHVVQNDSQKKAALKFFPESPVYLCDVEKEENIISVRDQIKEDLGDVKVKGIVHSLAFANYSEGLKPFHETLKKDFLQAVDISCFSFIAIANHFRELLSSHGAMVTISISTTKMASENYGYMAPVKAALESSLCFLAKSFSAFSNVRFNAVCAGLLKTSASAGIPGYIDSYFYAEKATLRKKNLETSEVADTAAFLLSPRSSGINGQCIVVDAGMGLNYFDADIVSRVV